MRTGAWKIPVLALCWLLAIPWATAVAAPVIVESGWELTGTVSFGGVRAAHYNPVDGLVYVVRRNTTTDGLYSIEAAGSITKLVSADRPATVAVDPSDGDVFFAEDYGGRIYRVGFGATSRQTWVSGFHSDDDDPVGMAIYGGRAMVVDRGYNGQDQVYEFSPDAAEGETVFPGLDPLLIDPVDITMGVSGTFLVDTRESADGAVFRLLDDGTLTALSLQTTLPDPVGVATDPRTGDLFVLDSTLGALMRVDPADGAVSEMFSGFIVRGVDWAGVDVTPTGDRVFVTSSYDGKVYTFSNTAVPAPAPFCLLAAGLAGLARVRRGKGLPA